MTRQPKGVPRCQGPSITSRVINPASFSSARRADGMLSVMPGIARVIATNRSGRSRSTAIYKPVQRLRSKAKTEVSASLP